MFSSRMNCGDFSSCDICHIINVFRSAWGQGRVQPGQDAKIIKLVGFLGWFYAIWLVLCYLVGSMLFGWFYAIWLVLCYLVGSMLFGWFYAIWLVLCYLVGSVLSKNQVSQCKCSDSVNESYTSSDHID